MSKVITFSKTFPAYHPKAGKPTYFVEKIWKSLWDQNKAHDIHLYQEPHDEFFHPMGANDMRNVHQFKAKHHTIRGGNRWKEGDYFSPRVWSGKPYNSKQIQFAPDIKIERVYDFTIDPLKTGDIYLNGWYVFMDRYSNILNVHEIANNDGLSKEDMLAWFKHPKPFIGQIIVWDPKIIYKHG